MRSAARSPAPPQQRDGLHQARRIGGAVAPSTMMLNQQQNEHDDQHQTDNAARTVPPAPAPGQSTQEEDDQQDKENGGKHDGTPLRFAHNAQSTGGVPLRAVRAAELV